MEIYGSYKKARNASWKILRDFSIKKLPVSVLDIAVQSNIQILKNSDVHLLAGGELAISFLISDNWYIVYNDKLSTADSRFSIAHEMGHIFLGHPLAEQISPSAGKTFDTKNKPEIEIQADIFAYRLLAPACVLWGLALQTPSPIASTCCIPYKAAKIRSKRMNELYKRNKFLTSRLEKQVYHNFENFISKKCFFNKNTG